MDFFLTSFLLLCLGCAALSYAHRGNLDLASNNSNSDAEDTKEKLLQEEEGTLPTTAPGAGKVNSSSISNEAFELFRKNYLVVYSLVMCEYTVPNHLPYLPHTSTHN
jgi:hypothetical protein